MSLCLRCEYPSDDNDNSFICEKVLKEFLLILWFKLADIDAIDVWDFNLLSLDFDALDVFQLSERPPLPHIFLHLSYMLQENAVEFAVISILLLFQLLYSLVDFITFFNFHIQLLLKLSLHICLSQGMVGKVTLNFRCKLFFRSTHIPQSLHEI